MSRTALCPVPPMGWNSWNTSDEIALSMKLQGKQIKTYFCLDCQAQYSNTTRQRLEKLLETYHKSGICSLFAKSQ